MSASTSSSAWKTCRARAFFRDFPELRLVLNHGGRPAVMTGILEPWRIEIRAFAKETSAVVKCSGLVERAGVEWSKDSVKPYVAELIEAFGTKRVMFATNWPLSTISSTYDLWVNTLAQILDELGMTSVFAEVTTWMRENKRLAAEPPDIRQVFAPAYLKAIDPSRIKGF